MSSASSTEQAAPTSPPASGAVPSLASSNPVVSGLVSRRSLLLFYLPLGFSGLMMTLDQPVVNSVLNRLPHPDVSVAALRVAFSLALVYEASHISMIDASTALSADRRTFHMLRRFYFILAGVLLVLASLVVFSPLYNMIVLNVMSIPPEVAQAARPASVAFLLWPIPIGLRRLYQGALIRHGHPKPVGAGGIVRVASLLLSLAVFGIIGTTVFPLEPSAIGVLSMLVSVTAESVAVHSWSSRLLRTLPEVDPSAPRLSYGDLWRFVFPLSATSVMNTLINPLLTAGIASAAVAWASPNGGVVAVASYSIAWSVAFLVYGPTLSMTQASIAWHSSSDMETRRMGRQVLLAAGAALGLLVMLLTFSPLAYWIFTVVLGTPDQTALMAVDVARWLVPMPLLGAASYMLRGRLIALKDTRGVQRAQLVDLLAMAGLVMFSTSPLAVGLFSTLPAAPAAAIAYNLVLCVDIGMVLFGLRKHGVRLFREEGGVS